MATQKGSIILEGQIGNLSFYRSNGKPLARQRSGVSKERIAKDPRYVRTRENNTEFGRASSAARLIRLAARLSLGERHELFEDTTLVNRLTPRMAAIVRADDIHGRGERVVLPKSLSLLHGFSFNAVSALKDVLFKPPHYTYRRKTGLLEVAVPELCPISALKVPKGGKFCSFHVAAILFGADYERLPFVAQANELLPLGHQALPPQLFRLELPEASLDPVIICFGISFFRSQGGYPVPIVEQGRNLFEVIGVEVDCSDDMDIQ